MMLKGSQRPRQRRPVGAQTSEDARRPALGAAQRAAVAGDAVLPAARARGSLARLRVPRTLSSGLGPARARGGSAVPWREAPDAEVPSALRPPQAISGGRKTLNFHQFLSSCFNIAAVNQMTKEPGVIRGLRLEASTTSLPPALGCSIFPDEG